MTGERIRKMEMDKIRKLYIDGNFNFNIKPDDFLIAIGKNKSNSVYHVVESIKKIRNNGLRFQIKVFKSDLMICLKRGKTQRLIPFVWYNRNKKPGR